jgi:hypothetical protein
VGDRDINAMATAIMVRSRLADLRSDAEELFELCRGLQPSPDFLPPLSDDLNERQTVLLKLLLVERERSRRLLALLSGSDG